MQYAWIAQKILNQYCLWITQTIGKCAKEMVVLVLGTMNYSLLYLAHLYHTSLFFTRQNMQYSTKPEKFGQFPFFAIVQRKKIWLWHADVLYGIFWSVNVLFWKAVCPGYLVETSCKVVNANKLCKDFDWSRLMWWWNMCIIYDKTRSSKDECSTGL